MYNLYNIEEKKNTKFYGPGAWCAKTYPSSYIYLEYVHNVLLLVLIEQFYADSVHWNLDDFSMAWNN